MKIQMAIKVFKRFSKRIIKESIIVKLKANCRYSLGQKSRGYKMKYASFNGNVNQNGSAIYLIRISEELLTISKDLCC